MGFLSHRIGGGGNGKRRRREVRKRGEREGKNEEKKVFSFSPGFIEVIKASALTRNQLGSNYVLLGFPILEKCKKINIYCLRHTIYGILL